MNHKCFPPWLDLKILFILTSAVRDSVTEVSHIKDVTPYVPVCPTLFRVLLSNNQD